MTRTRIIFRFIVATLAFLPTAARTEVDLKGKTISLYAGGSAGAGVDAFSRTFMPYLSRYLPGAPTILVKNMGGAGGIQAVSFAYNRGTKDGTTLVTMAAGPIQEAVYGEKALPYQLRRFRWIGSLAVNESMCFVWHTSRFRSIEDARTQTLTMSATGARSNSTLLLLMMNATMGTKFKPIAGYGGAGSVLAVERGEVDGRCSSPGSIRATHPDWLEQNKIRVLLDVSNSGIKEFGGKVPNVMNLIRDPEDKAAMRHYLGVQEIAYPYALAPETSNDVFAAYRAAFDKAVRDPAFAADVKRRRLELEPKTGAEVEAQISELFSASPAELARARGYLNLRGDLGKCQGSLCAKKKSNKRKDAGN